MFTFLSWLGNAILMVCLFFTFISFVLLFFGEGIIFNVLRVEVNTAFKPYSRSHNLYLSGVFTSYKVLQPIAYNKSETVTFMLDI